ncbi:unnamed protein product, partial [Rotaria sordida]
MILFKEKNTHPDLFLVGAGVLGIVRTTLWTKIEQYTTRSLKLQVFSHLHNLSLSW